MKFITMHLIFILLLVPMSYGQAGRTVPLDSLIQAALAGDEQQQILKLESGKIALDRSKLTTTFLPELNFSGNYFHQSEVARISLPMIPGGSLQAGLYDQYDFSLQLKQLLFAGFSRLHQRRLLNTSLEEQRYRLQYREKEIKFQVYSLAYRYLYQVHSLGALEASIQRLQLQQQRVRALFDQGFVSSLDTLDISSRMKEIQLQKISLSGSIRQTLIDLEQFTGITPIDSIAFGSNAFQFSLPSRDNVLAKLTHNFNLQTLNFQTQKLKHVKSQLSSEYLPKLYLAFAYHYGEPGVNFFEKQWMDYWTFGVQLSWNLWRWGRDRSAIRQQQYGIRQLALQQQLVRKMTQANIRKYLKQLDQLSDQQRLLQAMKNEKRSKFELVKKRWEQGQQTTLDVLQAERELTQAEMKHDLNRIQAKIVYLMLNKETGFALAF